MPVVTMKWNLPEEQEEFELAQKASSMSSLIWRIEQDIFRPARKHGYPDARLQKVITMIDDLVEKHAPTEEDGWPIDEYRNKMDATLLIGMIEEMYYDMKREEKI